MRLLPRLYLSIDPVFREVVKVVRRGECVGIDPQCGSGAGLRVAPTLETAGERLPLAKRAVP